VALLSDLIENSRQTTNDAWARLSDSTRLDLCLVSQSIQLTKITLKTQRIQA